VFHATTRAGIGLSVRYRRQLLRSLIDDTVVRHERALAAAAGAAHVSTFAAHAPRSVR